MPQERQIIQKIEYTATNRLVPHPENPRTIDENQFSILCTSIRENPLYFETRPILCNPQFVVFAGNMRLKAAQREGLAEVPVAIMDISEEKQRELMIRDNRENGEWNFETLSSHFDNEELIKWGFDESELGMDTGGAVATAGDDDVVDGGLGTPVTVLGDIYQIKTPNTTLRLICGDCVSMDVVNKVMEGNLADLCIQDAPYNVNYGNNMPVDPSEDRTIMNDSMSREEFGQFLRDAFTSAAAAMKDGAAFYEFMSSQEMENAMCALRDSGFHWSSTCVWVKDRLVLGRKDYHARYEPLIYSWKEGAARLCPVEDRTATDVWECPRPSRSEIHPTQKPVELYTKAIGYSGKRGWLMIDFFNGSGTSGIAALKSGLNLCAIELDPKFVDRAVIRWIKFCSENTIEANVTRNGSPITIEPLTTANA